MPAMPRLGPRPSALATQRSAPPWHGGPCAGWGRAAEMLTGECPQLGRIMSRAFTWGMQQPTQLEREAPADHSDETRAPAAAAAGAGASTGAAAAHGGEAEAGRGQAAAAHLKPTARKPRLPSTTMSSGGAGASRKPRMLNTIAKHLNTYGGPEGTGFTFGATAQVRAP